MRKNTIHLITLYMLIGAGLNFIAVIVVSNIDYYMTNAQLSATVFIIDLCIIVLLRDIAIKQDQVSKEKDCAAHSKEQRPVRE